MKRIPSILAGLCSLTLFVTCTNDTSRVATFNYQYCSPGFDPEILEKSGAPIFEGLGNLYYPVSSKSEKAQQYFNQGLTLAFAFNHGEAARSFREATRLDSACAMAWWGYAWVLGPNINSSMDPAMLDEANQAVARARALMEGLPDIEKMYIEAISVRYPRKAPADPSGMEPYSQAFAEGMRKMYQAYPNDPHVITIFAESLMNLHPWNYWTKDGQPLPWVKEIQDLLEKAISIDEDHPGANHYYIHTMEASATPEKALKSADLLRDLLPAAGHLVHMPSHIYIRTGMYHEGTLANERAAKADSHYVTQCKVQGAYAFGYFPHNYHFLAATAFFEGDSEKSLDASWLVARFTNRELMREPGLGTLQHYLVIPYYTMVHFGKWDKILEQPAPPNDLVYPRAVYHYARGMAHAAKNIDSAKAELSILQKLSSDPSLNTITIWELNKVKDLVDIANHVLQGEIAFRESRSTEDSLARGQLIDASISHFQQAMAIEDKLNYNEPPDWFFSVRHSLGHVLNLAGRYAEAEAAYRRDLFLYPANGWSLRGLQNSLEGQGREDEAIEVRKQFEEAWKYANVQISSSRVY